MREDEMSTSTGRTETKGAPVRIDPAKLAGKGLDALPPRSPRTRGNPRRVISGGATRHGASMLFQGDIVSSVYESGPAKLEIVDTIYDEFVQVLEGRLILTDAQGTAHEFGPGESCIVPKGFTGAWEMVGETFRELVVIEAGTFAEDMAAP